MKHECGSCGQEFATLTEKRIHQRDHCSEATKELDVSGEGPDEITEKVVQELSICDVCGRSVDEYDGLDWDETRAGVAVTLEFQCPHCSAHNENEAIMS